MRKWKPRETFRGAGRLSSSAAAAAFIFAAIIIIIMFNID